MPKISALPDNIAVANGDKFVVVQSGVTRQIDRNEELANLDALTDLVSDIATNNASTTKHGFLIKATAPSAGIRNVVAIDNAETVYKVTALVDNTNPADLGTAAPGTSLIAARRDHVHNSPAASYTDEQAQDAVGGILDDGGDIDFTYNDGTPSITAAVKTSTITPAKLSTAAKTDALVFIIDGGGSVITTGIKGDLEIPYDCTITQATLLADQSGSIVIDIWKDSYANYPPTDADSITASAPPTISSATKSQDATLTGWTTSITAGQTLRFNVDSVTTCTRVTLSLKVTRT